MIVLKDVNLQFAHKIIFENLNLHIKKKNKYSLIGINGSGKTTLLKMITHKQDIDKGEILFNGKNLNVAYLPQEVQNESDNTVLGELLNYNKELIKIKNRLKKLEFKIDKDEKAFNEYMMLNEKFEFMGGFNLETEAKRILSGIGFSKDDFDKKISLFSGGWKMRVYLSKLLLSKPDLLLLDEPTNHLDLPATIWLENYLKTFDSTLIVISHDRTFLDAVTNNIIEISMKQAYVYKGNYEAYLIQKENRENLLVKNYEKQLEEIESLKKFIAKFQYNAAKASLAKSKMKQLEKIEKNKIELPNFVKKMNFRLSECKRSVKEVIYINKVAKNYGNLSIFKDLNLKVYRKERIAIAGKNGLGKTTLLKMIASLTEYSGNIKIGDNVEISYFGQHQIDELNLKNDLITELESVASYEDISSVRNILGSFMFRGDDVFQKISTLSGGEKSRVALAKMLLLKSNLLLLDEPTNHLDIDSKKILLDALNLYNGTIVFISHDRDFIKKLSTGIFSIEDKNIIKYDNYESYVNSLELIEDKRKEKKESSKKDQKRYEAELRNKKSKLLRPILKKINIIEEEIENLENKLENYITKISRPEFFKKKSGLEIDNINKEINEIKNQISIKQEKWESLTLEQEVIEEEYSPR